MGILQFPLNQAMLVTGLLMEKKQFPTLFLGWCPLRLVLFKKLPSYTLESGIDIGQGITIGPGKFVKKNKHRALNKRRALTKCYKKPIKLENICEPWEKFQNLINIGPLIRL